MVSEVTPAPDSADDATETTPVEPEAEVAVTRPSGPEVSLELVFTGDCWTEITDADGERLFFDLGSDGRRAAVSGIAPLRVLFGSYANVSLAVNGNDYSIPASARRGETARFTINAP
jgi:cytoskeleton protein RodZ